MIVGGACAFARRLNLVYLEDRRNLAEINLEPIVAIVPTRVSFGADDQKVLLVAASVFFASHRLTQLMIKTMFINPSIFGDLLDVLVGRVNEGL